MLIYKFVLFVLIACFVRVLGLFAVCCLLVCLFVFARFVACLMSSVFCFGDVCVDCLLDCLLFSVFCVGDVCLDCLMFRVFCCADV